MPTEVPCGGLLHSLDNDPRSSVKLFTNGADGRLDDRFAVADRKQPPFVNSRHRLVKRFPLDLAFNGTTKTAVDALLEQQSLTGVRTVQLNVCREQRDFLSHAADRKVQNKNYGNQT